MHDKEIVPPEDIDDSVWRIVDESADCEGTERKLNG